MGWMTVGIALLAAILLDRRAHPFWFYLSISSAIAAFWSWGVMHNYAYGSAAARHRRLIETLKAQGAAAEELESIERLPIAISQVDARRAPDSWTRVNFVATLGGIASLIAAFALR